jgi:ABC-type uncharacterized transport system fused permease/ATPase subunit
MDARLDWTHVLSPGEQQRIAFARALLRRSQFVILDEATSAIDVEGEQLLYQLPQQMGSTYLSVARRATLASAPSSGSACTHRRWAMGTNSRLPRLRTIWLLLGMKCCSWLVSRMTLI